MKRNISIILIIVFCLLPVKSFAWASKNRPKAAGVFERTGTEVFYDDFSSDHEGGLPKDYSINQYVGKIYIEAMKVGEANKNCLVIEDNYNPSNSDFSGPTATREFAELGGIVAIEYKFKNIQTIDKPATFTVNLRNQSKTAFSINVNSGDGHLVFAYGDNMTIDLLGNLKLPSDEWTTVRAVFDSEEQKADVEIVADYLKNDFTPPANAKYEPSKGKITYTDLATRSDFDMNTIDNVFFRASRYEGINCIDYCTVYKDAERLPKNASKSMEAPSAQTPSDYPSGRYVNMLYNGKYYYFYSGYLRKNSRIYVSLQDLEKIFEREFASDDVLEENNIKYVPIRAVLENNGYTIGWIDETQSVTVAQEV